MQIKKRVPLIVLFLVVSLGALGFLLNQVLIPQVKENQVILSNKKQTLELKKQEYQSVLELNQVFDEIESEVEMALAALPSDKEIPNIPYQLAAIADEHELTNFNWSLSTTPVLVPKSNVQSLGLNVSFVGSYNEIISYLEDLQNSLRLINISQVTISGSNAVGEGESNLSVSMQANAYFTVVTQ